MKKRLYRSFVELSANRLNSYLLKKFTSSKISKLIIPSFVKYYQINQEEMEKTLSEYNTLQSLFIRKLKPNVRPIDQREDAVVSPVDGIIAHTGTLSEDVRFYVKGQTYEIEEMLGSKEKSERYRNGTYFVFYLSPSHYHRIHSPISAKIVDQWALGKKSYPVNHLGLKYGRRPLSRNYRVITEMKDRNGCLFSIIKVGALNVNSIEITNTKNQVKKGEELGYFSFGSTVILLFEPNMIKIDQSLKIPTDIKQGMMFATLQSYENEQFE